MKFYENLKFVYQIQTTLREWQQQDEDQQAEPKTAEPKPDDRKLPVNAAHPVKRRSNRPEREPSEDHVEGNDMNCQNHPEMPATAYCRTCGKPVCDECRRDAYGTVYCAEHAPAPAAARRLGGAPPRLRRRSPAASAGLPPVAAPPRYAYADVSPGLAFFLGMIPGVGAIYNGQYAKGLVHAIIWAC